ncbi:MAG: hypothetical protein NPINA01_09690 [Nitrospinaceae bacterium]|nr:MAG: hypothetical protein NPINA01_09690 [Nitrospinaceae bacterium]
MFFEVRIFDADGELKRVVSPKKLSKRYWKESGNILPDFSDNDFNTEDLENRKSWEKVRIRVDDTSV